MSIQSTHPPMLTFLKQSIMVKPSSWLITVLIRMGGGVGGLGASWSAEGGLTPSE